MRRKLIVFCILVIMIFPAVASSQGLKYLSADEFPRYDALLKAQGHPNLKTIFVVYDDSFSLPRSGLKCLNPKGARYEVYITGEKIVNVKKIPGKGRW